MACKEHEEIFSKVTQLINWFGLEHHLPGTVMCPGVCNIPNKILISMSISVVYLCPGELLSRPVENNGVLLYCLLLLMGQQDVCQCVLFALREIRAT